MTAFIGRLKWDIQNNQESYKPGGGTYSEAERKQNNDPRLSLEERYENKETYVQRVKKAVQELIEQGFFLKEDGDIYIKNAQNIAWPPEVIDRYPFWKMMEK